MLESILKGNIMKGIILAGGSGSRLYPMTKIFNKQLQIVYDKPLIYYPLSFLMLGGIKEILLISSPKDLPYFKELIGNGKNLGISITYSVQNHPNGLPEAFTIGKDFIQKDNVTLILGDNIFYGDIEFYRKTLEAQINQIDKFRARIFAYSVANPSDYGVVEFQKGNFEVINIEEKPKIPKTNYAIPGLYIFDQTVSERVKNLSPSARGELEITDLIKSYLIEKTLAVEVITRGVAWLDTGTPRSLQDASAFISAIEARQGLKIACLEEIAFRMGYIDNNQFGKLISDLPNCSYKNYLEKIFSMDLKNEKTNISYGGSWLHRL